MAPIVLVCSLFQYMHDVPTAHTPCGTTNTGPEHDNHVLKEYQAHAEQCDLFHSSFLDVECGPLWYVTMHASRGSSFVHSRVHVVHGVGVMLLPFVRSGPLKVVNRLKMCLSASFFAIQVPTEELLESSFRTEMDISIHHRFS